MNQLQQQLEQFKQNMLKDIPKADGQVLQFIIDLMTCYAKTQEQYEIIRSTFCAGYCWHFAHLLKDTFNRGEVCLAAPFGHFVWLDEDVPYDGGGIYDGEAVYFIPESYLGDGIQDFTHIPGVSHDTTIEEIMDIIHRYEDDNKLPHQDKNIQWLLNFS